MSLAQLAAEALALSLWLSLPALVVSVAVGLSIAIFQAVTQIQEQTIAFVPKLLAVGAVLVAFGPSLGAELMRFTEQLYRAIPLIVR